MLSYLNSIARSEAQENLGFYNWRDNSLVGEQVCSAVVVIVEVSFTRESDGIQDNQCLPSTY